MQYIDFNEIFEIINSSVIINNVNIDVLLKLAFRCINKFSNR